MPQPIMPFTTSPLATVGASVESGPRAPTASDGPSFKNLLLDSIRQLKTLEQETKQTVETLAAGGQFNATEVFAAVQKADLAFQMMMQFHDQLDQAYQQVQDIRV